MSFLGELQRRQVIRVALAYTVVALGVGQAADIFLPTLGAPLWTVPVILITLLLGFPIALVLAWGYDLTPIGVVRDPHDQRVSAAENVAVMEPPEAAPSPPSDRRSIAVMPLANLSGDPGNEYFSDGITDDILCS